MLQEAQAAPLGLQQLASLGDLPAWLHSSACAQGVASSTLAPVGAEPWLGAGRSQCESSRAGPAAVGQCGVPAQRSFLRIEGRCGSSVWPPHCRALTRTVAQAVPKALAGLAPGAVPAHSHAGIPASHGGVLEWVPLEHNMVCWGAQNYCHVKGVGEQEAGAAQCWLSICLQAAMRYEEGDEAGRSSRPQHSSGPQGQRLPVQRGPLEGPLPDASSQVSSGPRSPGDWARPPAPVLWDDGPAPAALIRVPATPRWLPGSFHSQFRPPWERPHTASASSRDLANHRTSSLPRKPIITRVSASVTARWSLLCPVSLEPAPQQWGTTDHSGWGGQCYGAGMLPWGEPSLSWARSRWGPAGGDGGTGSRGAPSSICRIPRAPAGRQPESVWVPNSPAPPRAVPGRSLWS